MFHRNVGGFKEFCGGSDGFHKAGEQGELGAKEERSRASRRALRAQGA